MRIDFIREVGVWVSCVNVFRKHPLGVGVRLSIRFVDSLTGFRCYIYLMFQVNFSALCVRARPFRNEGAH